MRLSRALRGNGFAGAGVWRAWVDDRAPGAAVLVRITGETLPLGPGDVL